MVVCLGGLICGNVVGKGQRADRLGGLTDGCLMPLRGWVEGWRVTLCFSVTRALPKTRCKREVCGAWERVDGSTFRLLYDEV